MKKNDLQPIVLRRDIKTIELFRAKLESLLPDVQRCVDCFFGMNLPSVEHADLQVILLNAPVLIDRHLRTLIPDDLNINGLVLSKDRVVSLGLYELPNRKEFETALSLINSDDVSLIIQYLTLKSKQVVIDESKFTEFEFKNSVAARTPDQLELYKRWQKMINGIVDFDTILREKFESKGLLRNRVFDFARWVLRDGDRLIPDWRTFRGYTGRRGSRATTDPEVAAREGITV